MNARSSHRTCPLLLWLAALLPLAVAGGCGSSGEGGDFAVVSTIFGYDSASGGFTASGGQGEAPLIPQNMCMLIRFSLPIDARTVSTESIIVQEVNLNVNPPAAGPDAAVSFTVRGDLLIICPLITFSDTNVAFGFEPNRAYQVLFQVPPSPRVIRSTDGKPLREQDRGPFRFRTTDVIFDRVPGAPQPEVKLLDATSNASLGFSGVPFKPAPRVQIDFPEPVIPSTVVNDASAGTSNSLRIELDSDGKLKTTGDRTVLPGRFVLTQTEFSATVLWTTLLSEIPTAPAGCLYVITVGGTVTDLAGNSKVVLQNDPGARDEFTFTTRSGPSVVSADPRREEFSDETNTDVVTSAQWGTATTGFLTPGIGGGTGADGTFDPLSATFPLPALAPQVIEDNVNQIVTLLTEDQSNPGNPRSFQFLRLLLPLGWTLRGSGPFPLEILVSGDATIRGTITVSGQPGESVTLDAARILPGAGGVEGLGGAAGGQGGSVTNGVDGTSALLPATQISPTYAELGFQTPLLAREGVSGRITSVTDFSVVDTTTTTDLATVFADLTSVWLQPNVGADDFRFERFHPAFKVESITGSVGNFTITVVSDPMDPFFRGSLTQETQNPYFDDLGNGVLRPPLLAETGDAYVLGSLAGLPGADLFDVDRDGAMDDRSVVTAGLGSDPQAVMQTFVTLGRSGGGGGGGGLTLGLPGVDDPTVDAGPGALGGSGWIGGDGGTAAPTVTVAAVLSSTRIRFLESVFDNGSGAPDPAFVGHLLNPQIGQGQVFTIGSVNAVDTCTIRPVTTLSGAVLDLSTVNSLIPNATGRITPPYHVGGAGGGGSGAHLAGSLKDPKGQQGYDPAADPNVGVDDAGYYDDADSDILEDFSEQIFRMPQWVPGAGGGAGGGSLRLVVAGEVIITSTGALLAEGGAGGESTGVAEATSSGGGGGSGGAIFLGTGRGISVSVGGRISAAGGPGGAATSTTPGGNGGNGRLRLENELGNMTPADFSGIGTPAVTQEHLGVFPGGGNSLGQSKFLSAGVLVPRYESVEVVYGYFDGQKDVKGASYLVHADGTVDGSSTLDPPPFVLQLSFTLADPTTGLATPPDTQDPVFAFVDPAVTPLSQYDGFGYVRFRITFDDPLNPQFPQTNVAIDSVEIRVSGTKP